MNRSRTAAVCAALSAALALSACDLYPGKKAAHETPPAAPTPASGVAAAGADAQIRTELASQNFGRAAALATSATLANPGDPQLHLLRARAEGYLGNAGEAVASLEKAVLTGLADRKAAFADPAFDRIRRDAAFIDAERRLTPQTAGRRATRRAGARDTVRAGDVEISEGGGRERVRAGDLVLDTRD